MFFFLLIALSPSDSFKDKLHHKCCFKFIELKSQEQKYTETSSCLLKMSSPQVRNGVSVKFPSQAFQILIKTERSDTFFSCAEPLVELTQKPKGGQSILKTANVNHVRICEVTDKKRQWS